jgi:hypothetical protein
MTLPPDAGRPGSAVIDGVDVDAVAAAVAGCAGVSALDGGQFGEVATTYLPGRKVAGVVVADGRVKVRVRAQWGVPVPDLAALIMAVLAPLTGSRPVDVTISEVDDPPDRDQLASPPRVLSPGRIRGRRPA